jgi:hypothetical protein
VCPDITIYGGRPVTAVVRPGKTSMGIVDKYRFEKRSGGGCSNSDYKLHQSTCCGGYFIEDDELSDLYFDPTDISRRVSLLREPTDPRPFPCPLCGAVEWNLVEVQDLDEVPDQWRWACHVR